MNIDVKMIKSLRARTDAGVMECKRALIEAEGDEERAVEILREKGIAKAAKRASKEVREGIVEAYIHPGARLGVLLELNCETDFVAKTDKFKQLARDLAMQIAATDPVSIGREDVPKEIEEKERAICIEQARNTGKPEKLLDRIATGMMEKFYNQNCLMEQEFVKESSKKVSDLINETIATLGENISIKRFARFKLGE